MKSLKFYVLWSTLMLTVMSYAQTTRYVRPSIMGNGSGSSWENASNDLQHMINQSAPGDRIFVAVGTYKPIRRADATGSITSNDSRNSFVMKQGVSIYGGFNPANGVTEDLDMRILPGMGSGSILSGNLGSNSSYHVVIAAGSNAGLLDGFIIQEGVARSNNTMTVNGETIDSKNGGGIAVSNAEVRFVNCWIRGNHSRRGAGAFIYATNTSTPHTTHFTNCIFSGNYADRLNGNDGHGGGIYSDNGRVRLYNCTISSNRAGGGRGGAILSSGNIYLHNSIMRGNTASNDQNGVRIDGGSYIAEYCLLGDTGDSPTSSTGNIGGNPNFISEPGTDSLPTTAGNFRLHFGSSCINTGNNSLVPAGIATHIGGRVRVQAGIVDRGAFESVANPVAFDQTFCVGNTFSDLIAEGENLKWYAVANGGTPLALNMEITPGTYYVSQTISGWESQRTAVNVTYAIETPIAPSPQIIYSGALISELEASGENLQWYNVATGGEPLDPSAALTTGLYYVSQTIDGCESSRTEVNVNTANIAKYVKPVAVGNGDGSNWDNAASDLQAVINASNDGDYIFVAGGTYKPNRKANALNTVTPNNRDNAFVLKSGVKIYGNFAGTETSLEERDLSFTENRSILSGDFNGNDVVTGSGGNLSISGNGENAYHVVISAGSIGSATVLDGFTITGGNANSYMNKITVNSQLIDRGQGGGLNNSGNSSPTIANCLFTGNHGGQGGGIYSSILNDGNLTFINTVFSKNLGISYGGGVYNFYGVSRYFNCTFWGNKANSGGGIYRPFGGVTLRNSIVYGNNSGINGDNFTITYSLIQGETSTDNGNINGNANPMFVNASGGDFSLAPCSPAINAGNNSNIHSGVTTDIIGGNRIYDGTVDMGAYEYQTAPGVLPPTASAQIFCTATVADLEATGESLKWYDVLEGGMTLTNDTELTTGTYYVSQTISGCESDRTEVSITVYNTPAPESESPQYFCVGATIEGLQAEGENLQWYDTAEGGTPLSPETILQTETYYVTQTLNDCESPRTAVNVTIYNTFAPESESSQYFCVGATITELQAEGENLQWYDTAEGGTPLPLETELVDGATYYVSQTLNDCESPRTALNVTIYPIPVDPEAESPQSLCSGSTVSGLLATGENLQWYDTAEGGTPLPLETELVDGTTYYVSQTINDCESVRAAINVTVYNTPAPEAEPSQSLCSGSTVSDLLATGENLQWYDTTEGGTPLPFDTILQTETYYVTQTLNDCESPRTAVNVTVYPIPVAPEAEIFQSFCWGMVSDLLATGENLQWYGTAEGGTPLALETELVDGVTYYVSQTINDCESVRTAINVTVYNTPAPEAEPSQSLCSGSTVSGLLATGENLQWYDTAEGGTPLPLETELVDGTTYYVSQTINDCESVRAAINVTVYNTPAPEAEPSQSLCSGSTVSDLLATGENLQWYDTVEDGTPLPLETELVDGVTYYVSQTINDCESPRTAVVVTYAIEAPIAPSPQNFNFSGWTIADLEATGENLQWYATETGGEPLDLSMVVTSGTYYVSQTINDCEGSRTAVEVVIGDTARYVTESGAGDKSGYSWANASDDLQAMINASSNGDYIFVAGGTYKPIRPANNLHTIDFNNRNNAFVLKSGVKIYGNFAGTETSLEERDLSFTENRSILSGDFNGNDVVTGSGGNLSISGNGENAHRVVFSIENNAETLLDGFTIQGGNAVGSSSINVNGVAINDQFGGGMYYRNSTTYVFNTVFTGNNATYGGGLYIGDNSLNLRIVNSVFSKNMATSGGSALYNIRRPYIINCTFWGNRTTGGNGSAIYSGNGTFYFRNNIAYGNNGGFNGGTSSVNINYSLIQGYTTNTNGNIPGNFDPLFMDPENGDFRLKLSSPVANRGNNGYVPGGVSTDIAGNPRLQDCAVDLGAYESEPIPAPVMEDNTFCIGQTIADIWFLGNGLSFYDAASGGSPLPLETELIDGATYYVSQTINGCESVRTAINVTVHNPPAPEAEPSQFLCSGTVSDLVATGENLQWYDVAEGGTPLDPDTLLQTGIYYVSQTLNDCESPRVEVSVILQVEFPIAPSPQTFMGTATIVDLEATGENLQWYDATEGGTSLALDMELVDGATYYVSQTINDCESSRTAVAVTINTVRYVTESGAGNKSGHSWANASDDLQAIINASSNGDYIFVAGGTYKPIRPANNLHTIDFNNRNNAFVLKSGVKIYGNFAGTETSLEARDLSNPANRSILSGDFNNDDMVTGSGESLSISGNGENAHRVVFSIGDNAETLLDGFTIRGGNAIGSSEITINDFMVYGQSGGGMCYWDSSASVFNTVFTENVAPLGGGLYVNDFSFNLYIVNAVFSKNIATDGGSALYNDGFTTIANSTFWGNRSTAGWDTSTVSGWYYGSLELFNSIIYGNNGGLDVGMMSIYNSYSLIQDYMDDYAGNIPGNIDPLFTDPENGDFRLKPSSPVINRGNNSYLPAGTNTDIAGNNRIQLNTVDLGAYESPRYGVIWTTSNNWLDNVEPDIEKEVFIEGDLAVETDYESFFAKTLTVEEGGSLIIESGSVVTVKEIITNKAAAADFVVENDGILLQTDEAENQGDITVIRNSNLMKRLDYTLWSSPVAGMLLKDFSEVSPSGGYGTLWNRVYVLGETAWEQIWSSYAEAEASIATFDKAKGYLYRSRNDYHPTQTQEFEGEFIGVPHNGMVTVNTPYVFNAVGNPYPSPMSADDFMTSNPGVNALYFWTNVNAPIDGSYTLNNWAYYTTMGGTGVQLNEAGGSLYVPNGTIQTGQGFLVGTSGVVPQVTFNNSMRLDENGAFFRQMATEKHRFWLNFSNEEALLNQILIGYVENATHGSDSGIDAEMFGYEGNAIYSLIDDSSEDYVIQGRALPFSPNDVVSLGLRILNPGSYSISLNDFDGIFEDQNQAIYLKDNLHQLYHNLKNGAYTFLSDQSVFENRFEIVYQEMLNTENPVSLNFNWIVYRNDTGFSIQTEGFEMKQVVVYDLLGREIYTAKAEGDTHQLPNLGADGMYIVKVVTTDDKILNKKVR